MDPAVVALEAALRQRFDIVSTGVDLDGRLFELLHPRRAEDLIDADAFAKDERLPYWADIWPSARVLASVLIRHHGNGRSALELGCGSGLVSCALSAAGYRVTATDYYADALRVTELNVRRSTTTAVDLTTRVVDWRHLPDDLDQFDLVVAADVLYERPYGELVAAAVARALTPHGAAIIADPGRVALEPFLERAQALGLRMEEGWEVDHAREGQRHTIRLRVLRWAHSRGMRG